MEFAEYMFLTLGAMLSMLAFFLKRESNKIEKISSKLREIEIELAKNGFDDYFHNNDASVCPIKTCRLMK